MSGMSFLESCFDVNRDKTPAQLGSYKLDLCTGSEVDGVPISKFFVEGAMIFTMSFCKNLGYSHSGEEALVQWQSPSGSQLYWGSLNRNTGLYRTTAPNNHAYHGFALLGYLIGVAQLHPGLIEAHEATISLMEARDFNSISPEVLGRLAVALADALRRAEPTKSPAQGWVLQEVQNPLEEMPEVMQDLRPYMIQIDDFHALLQAVAVPMDMRDGARYQGPELLVLRRFIARRQHVALLGPPGVGKSICGFEALKLEGFEVPGQDYQLFTGHDEVKSMDFLGGWQPDGAGGFRWVDACLVRAMTAKGGKGQPIFVEEWTRMPTRAQNMFISALSDGYVVLNEKPDANGEGEIVRAGPDFVLVADMNADPAADDLDTYGAAFASRVRKIEYTYPMTAHLLQILASEMPEAPMMLRSGVATTYDAIHKRWVSRDLMAPMSPRAALQWISDILAEIGDDKEGQQDPVLIRQKAALAAPWTWLRDVAGTDPKLRKILLDDVEASFRKAAAGRKTAKAVVG